MLREFEFQNQHQNEAHEQAQMVGHYCESIELLIPTRRRRAAAAASRRLTAWPPAAARWHSRWAATGGWARGRRSAASTSCSSPSSSPPVPAPSPVLDPTRPTSQVWDCDHPQLQAHGYSAVIWQFRCRRYCGPPQSRRPTTTTHHHHQVGYSCAGSRVVDIGRRHSGLSSIPLTERIELDPARD
jgi:hypothetical protein